MALLLVCQEFDINGRYTRYGIGTCCARGKFNLLSTSSLSGFVYAVVASSVGSSQKIWDTDLEKGFFVTLVNCSFMAILLNELK